MAGPYPRNVEYVRQLLIEDGPDDLERLSDVLRRRAIVMNASTLRRLATKFPELFVITADQELALAEDASPQAAKDQERSDPAWWRSPVIPAQFDKSNLFCLVVGSSGSGTDRVPIQISGSFLDGRQAFSFELNGLGDAKAQLQQLLAVLGSSDAIVAHLPLTNEIPLLEEAVERTGLAMPQDLVFLDLHELSLFMDPTLEGRSVAEICTSLRLAEPQHNEPDATLPATISAFDTYVRMYGRTVGDKPAWYFPWRCMVEAGSALARVLPAPPVPDSITSAVRIAEDPLVVAGGTPPRGSSASSLAEGFRAIARHTPNYRERGGQHDMAGLVAEAFDHHTQVAIEAPTGTGKSLAYLLPAASKAGREAVVVATHTRVLQRQLRDDAQLLRDAGVLKVPFRQVQGVANYICPREVVESFVSADLDDTGWVALAVAFRSLEEAPNGLWDDVTDGQRIRSDRTYARERLGFRATSASCERHSCAFVSVCPLYTRLEGLSDQPGILAVNHALVATWLSPDETGSAGPPGGLFGDTQTHLVVDEAHNVEDSITSAWTAATGSVDLGALQKSTFGRRGPLRTIEKEGGPLFVEKVRPLRADARRMTGFVEELGRAVSNYLAEYGSSESATLIPGVAEARPEYRTVAAAGGAVVAQLAKLKRQFSRLLNDLDDLGDDDRWVVPVRRRLFGLLEAYEKRIQLLQTMRSLADPQQFVYLLHVEPVDPMRAVPPAQRWIFSRIPLEPGPMFMEEVNSLARSLVMTSATLTTDDNFDFFLSRLGRNAGTDDAMKTVMVASPFNFDKQSAVLLTNHLPAPLPSSEREFCSDLAADQVGFLSISGGRTLGLFAARRRMELVADQVRVHQDALAERGVQLLVQGEDAPARIRSAFRAEPGTTVYGLRSYWEGFDAPGETLSYLLLEKPPYPHPNDPIDSARQRALADRGGDPFMDYVVPRTAIALKQGFGRLVRSETDRGAAIIADRRMQMPTAANMTMLRSLPTSNIILTDGREECWSRAIEFVTGSAPDLESAISVGPAQVDATIAELRVLMLTDPVAALRRGAQELLGIEALREEQLRLMQSFLAGRDALGLLPTGFGKSVCFQLPAILNPVDQPVVVVSPLVALIKDQVDELRSRRGIRCVAGITGRTTAAERMGVLRDLRSGTIRLLYLSPERLTHDPILRESLSAAQLAGLVMDEAHCISSWGHDFRPEFRQIAKAVLAFERCPRVGFTATATPSVEEDIVATLEMDSPVIVRNPVDRPDLAYRVMRLGSEAERTRELLRFVEFKKDAPGIVYVGRRAVAEEVAWILRQTGRSARSYHAGMLPEQREAIQDDFLAGTSQIIVATKAFGMGVNKSDVEWVVHFDLPESLESYAQEAGRGARAKDLTAECVLFYTNGDVKRREHHLVAAGPDVELTRAETILVALRGLPQRKGGYLVDPEALADATGIDEDDLNSLFAWLERAGTLTRLPDASVRGHVTAGLKEPADREEKVRFVRLVHQELRCRLAARRFIDLDAFAGEWDYDPDDMERDLIGWSLDNYIDFRVTQRRWRVVVHRWDIDSPRFLASVTEFRELQRRRLRSMVRYARTRRCRRALIAEQFGDQPEDCAAGTGLPCDHCRTENRPTWHDVPLNRVPDPENLVDVRAAVLQSVRWMSNRSRSYGRSSLIAALTGSETLQGRPLPRGLLWCPQFGCLRYVKANKRRAEEELVQLTADGAVEMVEQELSGIGPFLTPRITATGRALLGGIDG